MAVDIFPIPKECHTGKTKWNHACTKPVRKREGSPEPASEFRELELEMMPGNDQRFYLLGQCTDCHEIGFVDITDKDKIQLDHVLLTWGCLGAASHPNQTFINAANAKSGKEQVTCAECEQQWELNWSRLPGEGKPKFRHTVTPIS